MALAIEQAKLAAASDEVPVGAVVVDTASGDILGSGYNITRRKGDSSLHAEIVALRRAAASLGTGWYFSDCTLYVTLEPCVMCAGALVLGRLGRLVYGAAEPKFGGCGSVLNIVGEPRLNHRLEITAGVLEAECSQVMKDFFRKLRDEKK